MQTAAAHSATGQGDLNFSRDSITSRVPSHAVFQRSLALVHATTATRDDDAKGHLFNCGCLKRSKALCGTLHSSHRYGTFAKSSHPHCALYGLVVLEKHTVERTVYLLFENYLWNNATIFNYYQRDIVRDGEDNPITTFKMCLFHVAISFYGIFIADTNNIPTHLKLNFGTFERTCFEYSIVMSTYDAITNEVDDRVSPREAFSEPTDVRGIECTVVLACSVCWS